MLNVMACAGRAQPSRPFSAINIYRGFTIDAENEDWHFSWFVQDGFDNFIVFYFLLTLIFLWSFQPPFGLNS